MERKLVLRRGQEITTNSNCFVIAEIGQNHQGEMSIAKNLICMAKRAGADCVKFQKTCLKEKFTERALTKPYLSENSWGWSYGDHKRKLEFTDEQFVELKQFAESIGIMFSASAMDLKSLQFLLRLNLPFIKIGSGDVNNIFMIEAAAKANVPLIISTGMSEFENVEKIYRCIRKVHKNFALLHCVSAYPPPPSEINLNVINLYKQKFPDVIIGYSGHEVGIGISIAAVTMGAKIIERHFTLNKTWRGTDHKCSLETYELTQLIMEIRSVEMALGTPIKKVSPCEMECIAKLGKSIVLKNFVRAGHVLQKQDLTIKVAEPKGIDGSLLDSVVGKKVKYNLNEDQAVKPEFFY